MEEVVSSSLTPPTKEQRNEMWNNRLRKGSNVFCRWGGKNRCESHLCKEHLNEVWEAINPMLKAGTMWFSIKNLEQENENVGSD